LTAVAQAAIGSLLNISKETSFMKSDDDPATGFDSEYSEDYSESGFWSKLGAYATTAGREVIEKSLLLFYVAKSDQTPLWAKSMIFAALGYFINTIDAIPDITPLVGFADDLGVLAAALAAVASFINPDLKRQADEKLEKWFGKGKAESEPDKDSE